MSRIKRKQVKSNSKGLREENTVLAFQSKVVQLPVSALFDLKYTPHTILHRSNEIRQIQDFIEQSQECSFLMVTGLPGSGKTLTVNKVLNEMEGCIRSVRVNAMTFKCFLDFVQQVGNVLGYGQVGSFKQLLASLEADEDYRSIVVMIDEFENLFANSNEAFNLLTLASTTRVKLIGLSNDTEWLQVQARKLKVQLPELEHIVFKPYTNKEVELILAQRMRETKDFATTECRIEDDALRFCAGQATSQKGGDLRNVLDICKRIISSKEGGDLIITKDDLTKVTGIQHTRVQGSELVDSLALEQQLILLAIYVLQTKQEDLIEIEMAQLLSKLQWIRSCLCLDNTSQAQSHIKILVDYSFITLRETKVQQGGFRAPSVKVIPKLDKEQIKYFFQRKEAFKTIFDNL